MGNYEKKILSIILSLLMLYMSIGILHMWIHFQRYIHFPSVWWEMIYNSTALQIEQSDKKKQCSPRIRREDDSILPDMGKEWEPNDTSQHNTLYKEKQRILKILVHLFYFVMKGALFHPSLWYLLCPPQKNCSK